MADDSSDDETSDADTASQHGDEQSP